MADFISAFADIASALTPHTVGTAGEQYR